MRRIKGQFYREVHEFLTSLAVRAYETDWLVANPVLARFIRGDLFHQFASEQTPSRPRLLHLGRRLAQYYINNFRELMLFLGARRHYRRALQPKAKAPRNALILDAVFFTHQVLSSEGLESVEFPGLLKELLASGEPLVIAPTLYGDTPAEGYARIAATFAHKHILTVFDTTSQADLARLACFTLFYPLVLLWRLARPMTDNATRWAAFVNECVETLPATVVPAYLRYLHGRGLARTCSGELHVLSWFENRAGDKMFYKGLRTGQGRACITGAQLFIFPDNCLVAYVTEAETLHGLAPNRLLCNGPYYLPQSGTVAARVGPSLRYAGVFHFDLDRGRGTEILIALGQDEEGVSTALGILRGVRWPEGSRVRIRFHPSFAFKRWRELAPQGIEPAQGDLYEQFQRTAVLIGSETGVMVEAAACGIPVINLESMGVRSIGDMPELGRSTCWFPAKTALAIESSLERAAQVPAQLLRQNAEAYRRTFFCMPQAGRLMEQLGLGTRGTSPQPQQDQASRQHMDDHSSSKGATA